MVMTIFRQYILHCVSITNFRNKTLALFEKVLEAKVMSTYILIRANVSKSTLLKAYKMATDFENRYSAYKEESFLNKINKNAGKKPTLCTDQDLDFFHTCIEASRDTYGLFDITIGSLSHGAYHYGFANEELASTSAIQKQKKLVNYRDVTLKNNSIFLEKKGMRLDLGGIGKGYVAKQIAQFLAYNGASKLLVDVGGEIITRGKSYTIAVKDPFNEGNIAYIKTSKTDMSISTSGDYIRYIDAQNHHILDSSEGKSPHYYSSMSILKNGWDIDLLDAYATACFTLPLKKIEKIKETLGIALLIVDKNRKISLLNDEILDLKTITIQA